MYNQDYRQASKRLNDTYVMLSDEWVKFEFICNVTGKCVVKALSTGKQKSCHLNELRLTTPPLGYTTYKGVPMYIMRKPMREDWRQGLRRNNLFVVQLNGDNVEFNDTVLECMLVNYKTHSAKSVEWDGNDLVLSRQVVIEKGGIVYYKTYPVGSVQPNGTIKLHYGYSHLKDEVGGFHVTQKSL